MTDFYFPQNNTIDDLLKSEDTPFFLFRENELIQNYETFQKVFSGLNYKIYYSVKTNYESPILRSLLEKGSGAEVAAGHELFISLKNGFSAKDICFDGPAKAKEDLLYAIKNDVHIINTESFEEIKLINEIAREQNKVVNIGFRISLKKGALIKGPAEFYITKFGVGAGECLELAKKIKNFKNIKLIGLHAHVGSQNITTKPHLNLLDLFFDLYQKLRQEGFIIEEINIGGGYPSVSLKKTTLFDLGMKFLGNPLKFEFKNKIKPLPDFLMEIRKKFELLFGKENILLGLEPGRSISSSMGLFFTKVHHIKNNWVFLDGSTYSVPESIFFAERRFLKYDNEEQSPAVFKRYNVAGVSLNTADVFGLNVRLPDLMAGDVVVMLDGGAYSISRATQFTVLNPPVYFLDKNKNIKLIRRRGVYEDLISQNVS